VIAVPTFIIGIVYMSLMRSGEAQRTFFEERIWAGQVSRGEWALFILATPVMFYCAQVRVQLLKLWCRVMLKIRDSTIGPSKNLSLFGGVGVPLRSSDASLALEV
jgi:hypothetical protein